MTDERLLSRKVGLPNRRNLMSVLFIGWTLTIMLLAWIVQGGLAYTVLAGKFPILTAIRNMALPLFTRGYVF